MRQLLAQARSAGGSQNASRTVGPVMRPRDNIARLCRQTMVRLAIGFVPRFTRIAENARSMSETFGAPSR
jgi:hypothetical protein